MCYLLSQCDPQRNLIHGPTGAGGEPHIREDPAPQHALPGAHWSDPVTGSPLTICLFIHPSCGWVAATNQAQGAVAVTRHFLSDTGGTDTEQANGTGTFNIHVLSTAPCPFLHTVTQHLCLRSRTRAGIDHGLVCLGCSSRTSQTRQLEQQAPVSHRLAAGSPRSRCPQTPCLVRAYFQVRRRLSSRCVLTWQWEQPRPAVASFIRAPSPSGRFSPRDLITSQRPLPLTPSRWGSGLDTCISGGHAHPVPRSSTSTKVRWRSPDFSNTKAMSCTPPCTQARRPVLLPKTNASLPQPDGKASGKF